MLDSLDVLVVVLHTEGLFFRLPVFDGKLAESFGGPDGDVLLFGYLRRGMPADRNDVGLDA